MSEQLLAKALACRERLQKIRGRLPQTAESVREDELLEAYLSFQIFLLIQDLIDLATHLVSAKGLGIPGSQREAFELLAKHDLISREVALKMGAASALRNRIAHAYGDLDPIRLVREAPQGLTDAERFLDEISALLMGE